MENRGQFPPFLFFHIIRNSPKVSLFVRKFQELPEKKSAGVLCLLGFELSYNHASLEQFSGKISSLEGLSGIGRGFPGKWWDQHPWRFKE